MPDAPLAIALSGRPVCVQHGLVPLWIRGIVGRPAIKRSGNLSMRRDHIADHNHARTPQETTKAQQPGHAELQGLIVPIIALSRDMSSATPPFSFDPKNEI